MSLPKFTSHMLSNQPDQTAYLLNKLAAGGGGGEGKLYNTTGQNTDGAMTQKATTNALGTKADAIAVGQALAGKVDKEAGKGLSTNDFTDADKSKLTGIEAGAEVNVQSDWDQTDTDADDYIKNKPAIPPGVTLYNSTGQNTDGAMTQKATTDALGLKVDAVSGMGLSSNDFTNNDVSKLSGIESGAQVNVQSDWGQTDNTADDYIKNKPTIPAAQVNADWNAVSGVAEILNKPNIPSPYTLPPATTSTLGGIIVGNNLTVAADGTLSATGGGALPNNLVYYDNPSTQVPVTPYVNTSDIVNEAVTTAKIDDGAVTETKLDLSSLNFGNYSTSEVDTGFTWVDGKNIYKKTVNFGAMPNATVKSVNHSISNLDRVLKVEGYAYDPSGTGTMVPLPMPSTHPDYDIQIDVKATVIEIASNANRSNYSESYVTLYYTKTS